MASVQAARSAEKEKAHAVCLPAPAQGHINPILDVAKLLHGRGFHVTFVNTEYNHARLLRSRGVSAVAGVPGFRFATIPDGLTPSEDMDVTQDGAAVCRSIEETCLGPFRRVLAELNDPASGLPPVTCVISDSVMSFSLEAARELGVPYVQFWEASAASYLGLRHYRLLVDRGLAPPPKGALTTEYLDTPVEDVPGLRNMRFRDFPSLVRATDPDGDYMLQLALSQMEHAASCASAVILNSFDDLEGEEAAAMEALGVAKVYTVGPLPLLLASSAPCPSSALSLSLWKEDHGCLPWLDAREPGSVVYVNFGSITVMTSEELLELAWGLAHSRSHFLWIIRPDLVKGQTQAAAVLPPEFSAATAGRGLVASWCPQKEVLAHPAVGAFITHSGWNSTLESICAGVPVISWPSCGDQQTNCRYQCNEWGVGLEMDGHVRRDSVRGLVTELMEGDRGREMRKKAQEWKEKAAKATTKHAGSSHRNFDNLLRDVLLPPRP
ncbi:unnamed protein product [Alopecurus aequalis]